MASSLLRFGRIRPLKYLQVESWGIMRSHPVASFCIQTGDPAKPAKKAKAVSKTAEAPDERETLLAYKTAVDFPVRLSQSVTAFPAQSLGVAEPVTIVAAAASASTPDDTVAPATGSSEPGSLATDGSSSSSSSDSDSDSDSEDEKPDVKAETKTSQHELSESTVKKEAEKQDVISKVTEGHKHEKKVPAEPENTPVRAAEAVQEAAPAAVVATIEATQTTGETPSVSSEESVDCVPEICSATEDDPEVPSIKVSAEAPVKLTLDIREDAASQAVPDAHTQIVPTETTQPTSAEAPAEAEGTAKTAAEVSDAVECTEALVDCTPVVAEAAGEKLKADTAVEPPEEAAAAAPPEPEEPFDSSTYKNYQHHSYTPYTFVDLDVEMAKFRLPQPSSGRPSPRH